jgi:protein gp37
MEPLSPVRTGRGNDECNEAGVKFIFKQWGSNAGNEVDRLNNISAGYNTTAKNGGIVIDGKEYG